MTYDEFAHIEIDPDVRAVIVGINFNYNYRKQCMASLYMELNKAVFIATNKDKNFVTPSGTRFLPAGGSIVSSIEFGMQTQAVEIGKPQPHLFNVLRREHQLEGEPLSKFLMVGDSLFTDIRFGNNCGIDTLLVLSGNTDEKQAKSSLRDETRGPTDGKPTYISPYLAYCTVL